MPLAFARLHRSSAGDGESGAWREVAQPAPPVEAEPSAFPGPSPRGTSPTELFGVLLDEAKRATGSAKVLLCPWDAERERPKPDGVVVRGPRAEFVEEWWRGLLDTAPQALFEDGVPRLREDPEREAQLLCVPVVLDGDPLGVLCAAGRIDEGFGDEDVRLLSLLGHLSAALFETQRLRETSEYALVAGERDRIAREMHDGLAQSLFSASLALEVCKRRLRGETDVAARLAETQQLLAESLSELRRYIYDLQPARLDTLGLVGAIRAKVAEINSVEAVDVTLDILGPQRTLPQPAEACLYRVTQEALSNASRHSGAATVKALLRYLADGVELRISDDGDGFHVETALARSEAGHSMGLRSMRERALELGGNVRITSGPGVGTSIALELPL